MFKTICKYSIMIIIVLFCGWIIIKITIPNNRTLEDIKDNPQTNEEKILWKHLAMQNWGRPLDDNDKAEIEKIQLKTQKEKFELLLNKNTTLLTNEVIEVLKSFTKLKSMVENDKQLFDIVYNNLKPIVRKQIINNWSPKDIRFTTLYQKRIDTILDIVFERYKPNLVDYIPKGTK